MKAALVVGTPCQLRRHGLRPNLARCRSPQSGFQDGLLYVSAPAFWTADMIRYSPSGLDQPCSDLTSVCHQYGFQRIHVACQYLILRMSHWCGCGMKPLLK